MKIAIFTDYYLPTVGGVQSSIWSQKMALEALGHEVLVFCPSHQPNDDKTIVALPVFKLFKLGKYALPGRTRKVIEAATREIKRHKVDIVHVHTDMTAGVAGLLAAKALHLPVAQTMHGREDVFAKKALPLSGLVSSALVGLHSGHIPHKKKHIRTDGAHTKSLTARNMWRLMVNHANFADHVIVPSQHFADKLQHFGMNQPLTVISNGIEDSVWKHLDKVEPRNYGEDVPLRVMWCGRVSPEKRPIEFLKAIKEVGAGIKVDIYGDGPQLALLQVFIQANQLAKVVKIHGAVSQRVILREMAKHHVLVYTSFDFDTQGIVLLEAIATGLPVIYCDPDLSETVPKSGGILTKSPDASAIARSIRKLIGRPDRIHNMSLAMLAKRDSVAQSHQIKKLLLVYEKMIYDFKRSHVR